MKEFFEHGKQGYTWEPENIEDAINAMNMALENHESIAANSRQNALKHSWNAAGVQIDSIYSEIVSKRTTFKTDGLVSIFYKLVVNLAQWSAIMLLVLICMLPFMKVAKPKQKNSLKPNLNSTSMKTISISDRFGLLKNSFHCLPMIVLLVGIGYTLFLC